MALTGLLALAVFIIFGVPLVLEPWRTGVVVERVTSLVQGHPSWVHVYEASAPPLEVLPKGVPPPPFKRVWVSVFLEHGVNASTWMREHPKWTSRMVSGSIVRGFAERGAGIRWKACMDAVGMLICRGNPIQQYWWDKLALDGRDSLFWTRDTYAPFLPDKPHIEVILEAFNGSTGKLNLTLIVVNATRENIVETAEWIREISRVYSPVIIVTSGYDPRGPNGGFQDIEIIAGIEDAVKWLQEHKDMKPLIVEVDYPVIVWMHGDESYETARMSDYFYYNIHMVFPDVLAKEIEVKAPGVWDIYPVELYSVVYVLYKGCPIGYFAGGVNGLPPLAEYLGDFGFVDVVLPRVDFEERYERICVNRTLYVDWYYEKPWLVYNATIPDNIFKAEKEGRLKRLNWAVDLIGDRENYTVWRSRWINWKTTPSGGWLIKRYIELRRQLYGAESLAEQTALEQLALAINEYQYPPKQKP